MTVHAFADNKWNNVKNVFCFHAGIGFVKLYSLKVFSDGEWKIMEVSHNRDLVGSNHG